MKDPFETLAATHPITGRDLGRHGQPGPGSMFTREPIGCYVFSSGGSRGSAKLTYRDFTEFDDYGRYFDGLAVGADDVVANLFGAGIWGAFTAHDIALRQRQCVIVPIGSAMLSLDSIDDAIDVMVRATVNMLAGSPSAIISVGRHSGTNFTEQIRKIYCTGELMTPAVMSTVAEIFPHALARSTYAASDAGGIGMQCATLSGTRYHPLPGVFVEFLDFEGKSTGDEPGLVTVTKSHLRTVPIIRYQPGDDGYWRPESCAQHPRRPVFQLLGRADATIALGSALVPLSSVRHALEQAFGLGTRFTVIVHQEQGIDCISLEVVANTVDEDGLPRFLDILYDHEPTLARMVAAGRCSSPRLRAVEPSELQHSPVSGKPLDLIDRRRLAG